MHAFSKKDLLPGSRVMLFFAREHLPASHKCLQVPGDDVHRAVGAVNISRVVIIGKKIRTECKHARVITFQRLDHACLQVVVLDKEEALAAFDRTSRFDEGLAFPAEQHLAASALLDSRSLDNCRGKLNFAALGLTT